MFNYILIAGILILGLTMAGISLYDAVKAHKIAKKRKAELARIDREWMDRPLESPEEVEDAVHRIIEGFNKQK